MRKISVALFFTRGVSLKSWDKLGILEREISLYRLLSKEGLNIAFLTYGGKEERKYESRLKDIKLLFNRYNLPLKYYTKVIPFLFAPHFLKAQIIKTNQILGGDVALKVSRLYGKKLIARCGYLLSEFKRKAHGENSPEFRESVELERRLFEKAKAIIVTTEVSKKIVMNRYGVDNGKVFVVPNYVEIEIFKPGEWDRREPNRIIFIGRLEKQKNLVALFEAVRGLDVEIYVVGGGSLRKKLETMARDYRLKARFFGFVPHRKLPELLNSSSIYILPSLYEGHPKTLLEAMASGIAVIGTDVAGIRELIKHGENGILSGTSPSQIRKSIKTLLYDEDLRRSIGEKAREFVSRNFSLRKIYEKELDVYRYVLKG